MKRTLIVGLLLCWASAAPAIAQDQPPQRVIRTYVPPDQLVSFQPQTPFPQFIEFINPIFERLSGKIVIDPEQRAIPIDINITGMHYLDAFELVLNYNDLTYRETDRYFIIEELNVAPTGPLAAEGGVVADSTAQAALQPATSATREIKINAILFQVNQTKARELGVNYGAIFGQQAGGGGAAGGAVGGGLNQENQTGINLTLKTDELFDPLRNVVIGPDAIPFSELGRLFRVMEDEGIGQTIGNPSVSVQSGKSGRIQVGSDIPIQTSDFAGNTRTEFVQTGIIINVVPTLVEETDPETGQTFSFVHLIVNVENSSGQPSAIGTVINRSTATTEKLLLDGEQTVIGGLYNSVEQKGRRGVPILKNLPLLKHVFSIGTTTVSQQELLIFIQADVLDPLPTRARQVVDSAMETYRDERQRMLERFRQGEGEAYQRTIRDN
ncbi:MAG: type II and III secretion system protein [Bacteroidota bacterium]